MDCPSGSVDCALGFASVTVAPIEEMAQEIELERLRSPEIRDRIESGWTTALFACGAVEQHGPHLPLFVDAEHGSRLALEIARRLGKTLVAPTIRVGCSEHHMAFSGTLSLRRETLEAVVTDYVTSLVHHGFERVLIVPSHGGNFEPLREMEQRLGAAAGGADVRAYTDLVGFFDLWRREVMDAVGHGDRVGGHADFAETSVMLSLHSELVRMDLAEAGSQAKLEKEVIARIIREGFDSVTPNGILGDPRGASAAIGRSLIDAVADEVSEFFLSR